MQWNLKQVELFRLEKTLDVSHFILRRFDLTAFQSQKATEDFRFSFRIW